MFHFRFSSLTKAALAGAAFFALSAVPAHATQIGQILVCYACSNTGNAAVDAALASNPDVAGDGILFAFRNTSGSSITGGIFSDTNATPNDSFALPSIAAGSTYILIPGKMSDGGVHLSGGLFANVSATQDTSDGQGGVNDASVFKFTGLNAGLAVTSMTAGTSTGIAGTFTAGDPGLIMPFRDNPSAGSTSFLGLGPSGDGGCSNCYFGVVATLNTPTTGTTTPEPASIVLSVSGLGILAWIRRRQSGV